MLIEVVTGSKEDCANTPCTHHDPWDFTLLDKGHGNMVVWCACGSIWVHQRNIWKEVHSFGVARVS